MFFKGLILYNNNYFKINFQYLLLIFNIPFQIVRQDRTLEQIVFPIPEICEYITHETKVKVLHTAERDDQGSKVSDFFERTDDMFSEMKWQKKLRGNYKK